MPSRSSNLDRLRIGLDLAFNPKERRRAINHANDRGGTPAKLSVSGFIFEMRGATVNVNGTRLAWALAEVVCGQLPRRERNYIHVAIGAGDTFTAVTMLVEAAVRRRIPLGSEVLGASREWMKSYVGDEGEPRLKELIGQLGSSAVDGSLAVNPAIPTDGYRSDKFRIAVGQR